MKLFVMFGQRKERYEGEFAPEALLVWDEYSVDENPDGFAEDCQKTRDSHQEAFTAIRLFAVIVDQDYIRRQLLNAPVMPGLIEVVSNVSE